MEICFVWNNGKTVVSFCVQIGEVEGPNQYSTTSFHQSRLSLTSWDFFLLALSSNFIFSAFHNVFLVCVFPSMFVYKPQGTPNSSSDHHCQSHRPTLSCPYISFVCIFQEHDWNSTLSGIIYPKKIFALFINFPPLILPTAWDRHSRVGWGMSMPVWSRHLSAVAKLAWNLAAAARPLCRPKQVARVLQEKHYNF